LIGDLKGVSLLAELQRAERQRHMRLQKLCEKTKTTTMDLEHLGEAVKKVSMDVEESAARVEAEIDAVFDLMQQKLNERRAEVKKMLGDIGGGKNAALGKQHEEIEDLKKNMEEVRRVLNLVAPLPSSNSPFHSSPDFEDGPQRAGYAAPGGV
jgi:uncharacterized protein with HEPN domain